MTASKLYAVTSVFNPRRFESRIRLYKQFAKHMAESGVELFTVELGFADRPYDVTSHDNPMHLQLRTSQELWHKERLLNLGIQRLLQLVPSARCIAWIDADVTFCNPHWATETLRALEHFDVVQPFGEAINLDPHHHRMWSCPSAFRQFHERGYHQHPPLPLSYCANGHPGLAWAATVDALHRLGGLLDCCISGSADTLMANALRGDWSLFLPKTLSAGYIAAIERWAKRADGLLQNLGFVPGVLSHHWHGRSEQRGYEKRWDIVGFHQFDPHEDLITDAAGLLRFAGNKPRLADDIRRSLSSRNEDSIDK